MNSRIPPIGFIGMNAGPASFKYVRNQNLRSATSPRPSRSARPVNAATFRPVGSSHAMMRPRQGGVKLMAAVSQLMVGGAAQVLMNSGRLRKSRRNPVSPRQVGPATSI
jgi:hypothetical protein